MNTFPLFKQNKSYQSSILTLIIRLITSAIIPTITTIINKTTNNEHPPYNIRGTGRYGLSMGHGLFQKKAQVNKSITSSRPNSSQESHQLYLCTTVDQLCRIIAAKINTWFHSIMLYIHFRNINMLIDVKYPYLKYTRYLISFIRSCFSCSKAAVLPPWVNEGSYIF